MVQIWSLEVIKAVIQDLCIETVAGLQYSQGLYLIRSGAVLPNKGTKTSLGQT